jgi:hypothetical protein
VRPDHRSDLRAAASAQWGSRWGIGTTDNRRRGAASQHVEDRPRTVWRTRVRVVRSGLLIAVVADAGLDHLERFARARCEEERIGVRMGLTLRARVRSGGETPGRYMRSCLVHTADRIAKRAALDNLNSQRDCDPGLCVKDSVGASS